MSEFALTEDEYSEIKAFTIDELKSGIAEIKHDLSVFEHENMVDQIKQAIVWLKAHEEELSKRDIGGTSKRTSNAALAAAAA